MAHSKAGKPLLDVRSPKEFTGEKTHMEDYPQEGSLRGGHIPGAKSVPWGRAVNDDGTFKSADELKAIYEGEVGLKPSDDVVAYCRIGERSSLTWFVLTYLLGYPRVRNYDGSWCEWGNLVRADRQGGVIRRVRHADRLLFEAVAIGWSAWRTLRASIEDPTRARRARLDRAGPRRCRPAGTDRDPDRLRQDPPPCPTGCSRTRTRRIASRSASRPSTCSSSWRATGSGSTPTPRSRPRRSGASSRSWSRGSTARRPRKSCRSPAT